MVSIAFLAIHRFAVYWLERNFTILLAVCANSLMHFHRSIRSWSFKTAAISSKLTHLLTSGNFLRGYSFKHSIHLYMTLTLPFDFTPCGKFLRLDSLAFEPQEHKIIFLKGSLLLKFLLLFIYI